MRNKESQFGIRNGKKTKIRTSLDRNQKNDDNKVVKWICLKTYTPCKGKVDKHIK